MTWITALQQMQQATPTLQPWASHMLGKCSSTELHQQALFFRAGSYVVQAGPQPSLNATTGTCYRAQTKFLFNKAVCGYQLIAHMLDLFSLLKASLHS